MAYGQTRENCRKMLRRQIRQRKEYIYRKTIEQRERTIQEKKQKLKRALDENKPIPTDLRDVAISLHKTLDWDDEGGEGIRLVFITSK